METYYWFNQNRLLSHLLIAAAGTFIAAPSQVRNRSPWRLGLPRVQPTWIIRGFLLIPLALSWFALSPAARALLP
ncbi:MAG: hypothetical protein DMF26_08980, partial [Verrucomicrobia bacterium]